MDNLNCIWGNRYNSNYPLAIANLIIEQQISFKAAITVKKRFAKKGASTKKAQATEVETESPETSNSSSSDAENTSEQE